MEQETFDLIFEGASLLSNVKHFVEQGNRLKQVYEEVRHFKFIHKLKQVENNVEIPYSFIIFDYDSQLWKVLRAEW